MGKAAAWPLGNDIRIRLDLLQSSTMGSGSYLNSSTGVTVEIWSTFSTSSTSNLKVTSQNVPYVTASNGRYDVTIESTEHGMSSGTNGVAIIKLSHSGLNGRWEPTFVVGRRRTT